MNALREWLEQLEQRERLLVLTAGALALIALVVLLGVRPILNQSERGQRMVDDKRALLAELQEVAARLGPQRGTTRAPASGDTQSLVLVVDQTTRRTGLAQYLKRNQPDGTDSIRLRFENAPFDTLVSWLDGLQQQGMTVTSANIDVANEPGRVNCNLTLARSGG
jgi:type II secretory pathway component PulM